MWMAPNLVTLLGFAFIAANLAILEIYVPDLVGPVWQASPNAYSISMNH